MLAEALEHAERDECSPLAVALTERPCSSALGGLIRRWDDLDEFARARLIGVARRDPKPVCAAAHASDPRQRQRALACLARLGLVEGLDAAAANLEHADQPVARLAAAAIDQITLAHVSNASPGKGHAGDAARLDEALARALETYPKHRQTGVLVAAARLLDAPGPALQRWLADREHPTHLALRGFMKRLPDEQLAPLLLNWLGLEHLGAQALEHVARLARTAHCADLIRGRTHLLQLPEQRARLRRLDPRRPAAPPASIALEMDDEAQAALPAWLLAIPMPEEQLLLRLTDGASFRTPRARLAALRALSSLDDSRADAIVAQFCFDEDERLARLATQHCIRRRVENLSELLRRLLRSAHRSVRLLAAAQSNRADFEALWSHWSGAGPSVEHRLAARMLVREERHSLVAAIRRRLATRQRETCLRALRMAGDLHVLAEVELELLALARSEDVRIAATAVKALGQLDSDSSRSAVVASLRHADVRTRANAIEVLAPELIEQHRPTLEALADAPENRPRANAITAIARVDRDDAASRLDRMLTDDRPLHRLSALWAVDAAVLTHCAERVARLARQDLSRPVRERARRTARRLLAAMIEPQPVEATVRTDQSKPESITIDDAEVHALLGQAERSASAASWLIPFVPATLAQSSTRLSEISRSFVDRQPSWPTLAWEWLPPALAAAAVVAATAVALRWSLRDARRHGPAYRAIAVGLNLSRRERRLLQTVAARSGRENAAGMLLSRGTFDHYARSWRVASVEESDPRIQRLAEIRGRIFG